MSQPIDAAAQGPLQAAIEAGLRAASERAAAIPAPPTTGGEGGPALESLAVLVRSEALIQQLIGDIQEALSQVFVAGLAFPDPELPDELAALAERAERFGLAAGVERIERLRVWLDALSGVTDRAARAQMAAGAWGEAQKLLAWLRLFRGTQDFLMVQAKMAARATDAAKGAGRRPAFPTRSLSAWPIGMEIRAQGQVRIYALDLDTYGPVVMWDQLSEFDRSAPLQGRAISRLFQSQLDLGELLSSVIRFEAHPVVTSHDAVIFRPSFQSVPRALPVAAGFEGPIPPALPLDDDGAPAPYRTSVPLPYGVQLRASRAGDALSLHTPEGLRAELTPPLRFNLLKLLARARASTVELSGSALLGDDGALDVLSLQIEPDGRGFPELDLHLYRLPTTMLAARARRCAEAMASDPLAGAELRCAAYLFGGADADEVEALRAQVPTLPLSGLDDHYRAALLASILGAERSAATDLDLAEAALRLGALGPEDAVDAAALAWVLGLDQASPADLRRLDGGALYQAVWLSLAAGLLEDEAIGDRLGPALEALYTARYAGELEDMTPGDVCARALLLQLLQPAGDAAGDGADVTDTEDAEDTSLELSALEYLQAHLEPLASTRRQDLQPLPDAIELIQLADTLAALSGEDRHGATVAQLSIPSDRLMSYLMEPLHDWLRLEPEAVEPETTRSAADALLVIAASGASDRFVI